MSKDFIDGGPAFPMPIDARSRNFTAPVPGMSLRDWLAGQALGPIIAATCAGQHDPGVACDERPIRDCIARDAYDMADAMIRARDA